MSRNCWDYWVDESSGRWQWLAYLKKIMFNNLKGNINLLTAYIRRPFGFIICFALLIESLMRLVFHSVVIAVLFIPAIFNTALRRIGEQHVTLWQQYLDCILC